MLAALSMLSLTGCFKPNKEGIKGQAYLTTGDYYKGHAMVDLPIYCYSTQIFEQSLESLKAHLSAEWKIIGEHNAKLKADWLEAENTYLSNVKVFLKDLFEEQSEFLNEEITNIVPLKSTRFREMQGQQQSKIDAVRKEIKELEAQKRATKELAELLNPFIAKQRRLLEEAYVNIEAEVTRANDLIEKINKAIVEKNLALSLYDKFDLDVSRNYSNINNCWYWHRDLSYPDGMSSFTESYSAEEFFSYDKEYFSNSSPLDTLGRVLFHETKDITQQGHISYLPKELTPYLGNEIKEAFYKHHVLAVPRLLQIKSRMRNSVENANDALLVYANKNGISVSQVKSILKNSIEPDAFERQISAKKYSLEALENFDISSAVASEISDLRDNLIADIKLIADCIVLLDDADGFDMLYEAFRYIPKSTSLVNDSVLIDEFKKFLVLIDDADDFNMLEELREIKMLASTDTINSSQIADNTDDFNMLYEVFKQMPKSGNLVNDSSLIDDADDFNMLYEAFRQKARPTYLLNSPPSINEFEDYLEAQGFERPSRPNYASIEDIKRYEIMILSACSSSNLIVRTDLNGEFTIPDGTTRYFAYLVDDDSRAFCWTAPVSEMTDQVFITSSSITATNPLDLLFSESELQELLSNE